MRKQGTIQRGKEASKNQVISKSKPSRLEDKLQNTSPPLSSNSISQSRPSEPDQDNVLVDNEGKNGLIAAIGIILGFTVTFFGQWSLDEGTPQPPFTADASATVQSSPPTRVPVPLIELPSWLNIIVLPGWTLGDIFASIVMIVGIIILIYALHRALLPYKYNAKHYRTTVNWLVRGIVVVLLGIGIAILV